MIETLKYISVLILVIAWDRNISIQSALSDYYGLIIISGLSMYSYLKYFKKEV